MIEKIKLWAKKVKSNVSALALALKHPRTPLYAKIILGMVVGYALNPIDLIPDFIPVIGYLDDIILLPIGILIAVSLIPSDILEECKEKAKSSDSND